MSIEARVMAVPTFERLMYPLLNALLDGQSHHISDLTDPIAVSLALSDADRSELTPSGHYLRLPNRIYWAKLHLSQAKAVETTAPGTIRITERGRALLRHAANEISIGDLANFEEYRDFKTRSRSKKGSLTGDHSVEVFANGSAPDENAETPEENIQSAYRKLKDAVTAELLDTVRSANPRVLSTIMVGVLVAMGYGEDGSGIVLDGVNDGGIDGLVRKDRLGLSSVYIQAKRYKEGNNVGSPAIQQFAGSMQERKADEGVFVTTSDFTKAAHDSAAKLHSRIVLINGERLAEIMFDLGVGVKTTATIHLKRVDADYFIDP